MGNESKFQGTYDKENVRLYVNGQEIDSQPESRNLGTSTLALCIANVRWDCTSTSTANEVNDHFYGIIDQVEVSNVTRSASWIRESYEMIANPGSVITFGSEVSY